MNDEFQRLAEELEKVTATGDSVVSRVDVPMAVTRGRARMRRRRLAVVGAAMTAVVVASALTLQLGGSGHAAPAAPAAVPTAGVSTPAAKGVDPLTSEVRFGWLPEWVHGSAGISYEVGYHGDQATAKGPGQDAPRIILSVFPAGPEPELSVRAGEKLTKVPADPVNGRTAYWLEPPTGHGIPDLMLRWQTASGRWAQIIAYPLSGDDAKATLLKVAAGAQFGRWDVPMPVQLTGLPASWKATDASLTRPSTADWGGAWDTWLAFAVDGQVVSVNVNPPKPAPTEPDATPTELLDGGVYADPNPPTCTTMQGMQVCVNQPQGAKLPSLEELGGLPGLLNHISVLGNDDAKWTTDVVR